MRRLLSSVLFALLACEQEVSLGSECPRTSGPCPRMRDAAAALDDGGTAEGRADAASARDSEAAAADAVDAATADGAEQGYDAAPPERDAAPDDARALYPLVANPSFELADGGAFGELPFQVSGSIPIPIPSPIAPWYSCRTGTSVRSADATVMPRDGDAFVTFPVSAAFPSGILNALAQDLAQPLAPGQRYAFAIDVWSEHDAVMPAPIVEVRTGVGFCSLGTALGSTQPVETGGWQKRCVDFTVQGRAEGRTILLMVDPQTSANGSSYAPYAVHLDNIRSDPECGN